MIEIECHMTFEMPIALNKHAETVNVKIQCATTVLSKNGICQQQNLYSDIQDFLSLVLKLLIKTPMEGLLICYARQITFLNVLHIYRNGHWTCRVKG